MTAGKRRYFGGIYASSRTLNAGDRVTRRVMVGWRGVSRSGNCLPAYGLKFGTIVYVVHDLLAGRTAMVHWDDGSEQLNITSDLRRAVRS